MPPTYGARTPTQTAWLAAAAGVVMLLAVGGGWLAWRGLQAAPPALTEAGRVDSSPVSVPAEVAFGAPELVDGVPWGYPLTPQGAAAAAVTAVAATGQPDVVFDPDRFAEVAAVVFTDQQADREARQVEMARTELELSAWGQQPPSRRMYFFAPLAVRLTDYDQTTAEATVEVWSMSLVGVGDAGGAVFTTSIVGLTADDIAETWVIDRLDSSEGPTPLVHDPATVPGRTRALLRDALATWPLPLPPGGGQ